MRTQVPVALLLAALTATPALPVSDPATTPPTTPAAATTPDSAAAASFGASLSVEVVEVEVFVTDAHGAPVSGLGKDDFVLRVDGRARDIVGLYEAAPQAELVAVPPTVTPGA